MPLTSLRLKNFKCFADSGEIPLAPLTVIFGRNNTGKSSILQSLLLLQQSNKYLIDGPCLNLSGPDYMAGTYADVIHQHNRVRRLIVDCGVSMGWGARYPTGHVKLESRANEPHAPILAKLEASYPGQEAVRLHRKDRTRPEYEVLLGKRRLDRASGHWIAFRSGRFFPYFAFAGSGLPGGKAEDRPFVMASALISELEHVLNDTRSVGAFRAQPLRRYEYQGRTLDGNGFTSASVMDALIEDHLRSPRAGRGTVLRAVNQWLKKVGRVRILPIQRVSQRLKLFEVRVRDLDAKRWANFADVGFGIGQALPVIVEGLRTPKNGLFLVQEPEIHLHPDAQLAMADFLIELAKNGRQVIVETHSEDLLLRIRRKLVERKKPVLKREDVSIVYVDKRADGRSYTTPLEIDPLGQIPNWPTTFMEETTDERMALLRAMARRAESA